MEDAEQTAKALEGIEFGLLLRGQRTGPRFFAEFVHQGMVALGELQLEQRARSTGSKRPLEFHEALPDGCVGVGREESCLHGRILRRGRFRRKAFFEWLRGSGGCQVPSRIDEGVSFDQYMRQRWPVGPRPLCARIMTPEHEDHFLGV